VTKASATEYNIRQLFGAHASGSTDGRERRFLVGVLQTGENGRDEHERYPRMHAGGRKLVNQLPTLPWLTARRLWNERETDGVPKRVGR
jgi:hypothetical protein